MKIFFGTTRTVTNIILRELFTRFPVIEFIIPHVRAFLATLADKINCFLQYIPIGKVKININIYDALKGLYYEIAGFSIPRLLENLLKIVDASHLFYGSDYLYTPEFNVKHYRISSPKLIYLPRTSVVMYILVIH